MTEKSSSTSNCPTTETTLEAFSTELIANQISKNTVKQYRYLLTALSRHYPAKSSFEEISGDDLKNFFADMDGRKAKSSINQQRAMIKRFYKWLEGGDEEYPAKVKWIKIRAPKTTVQRGDLITKEEMSKLLGVARNYMEKAFLIMLYESGARISEFCSITIGDLRINSDEVLVTIRRGKTGPRSLTLVKSLSPLKMYLNLLHPRAHDPDACLFFRNNRSVKPLTVKRMLDELTDLADIRRRITPHLFRHSRATELANRGWNEAKMRYYLGWKPTSSMPSTYTHLAHGDTRNEIRAMEGLSVEDDGLMSSEALTVETPFEIEAGGPDDERLAQLEARFDALLDYLARQGPSITTDPRIVREQMGHASWIGNGMEGADEEDKRFLRDKLEKFEGERREHFDESRERYWRSRRSTDGEDPDRSQGSGAEG